MMKKRLQRLGPAAAIGIGAGVAAAVLCSLAGHETIPAAVLANLSPLPIMIAMLGYGTIAGASAVASAALTVSTLFYAQEKFGNLDAAALAGLTFVFFLGLPALWLSLLSVLSRVKGSSNWVVTTRVGSFFAREYCPLERILSYATSLCATIGVAIAIYVSSLYGGFDIAVQRLSAEIAPYVEQLIGAKAHLPANIDARGLARASVLAAAPLVAGCSLVMLMFNLWLAGRITQLSGQLPRPWPDIAWELRLPRIYLLVFGASSAIGPYLGGLPGLIVVIVAVTLGVAFALLGLAVAHYLLRGSSFRIPLLAVIYLGLIIPVTWIVFLLALVVAGILDAALSLRDRKNKSAPLKP
ncbi:MAG TPA: hypothetical protein VL996_10365 [Methylocella sp.]|nr:hypothetical protein [Methylocella sp.]